MNKVKKIEISLFIIMFALTFLIITTVADAAEVKVNSGCLNFRNSRLYKTSRCFPTGTQVKIIGRHRRNRKYLKVRVNGRVGYLWKYNINRNSSNSSSRRSRKRNRVKMDIPSQYTLNSNYRIRSGPSKRHRERGSFKSAKYNLTGYKSRNGQWLEVRCEGCRRSRWVHRNALKVKQKSLKPVTDNVAKLPSNNGELVTPAPKKDHHNPIDDLPDFNIGVVELGPTQKIPADSKSNKDELVRIAKEKEKAKKERERLDQLAKAKEKVKKEQKTIELFSSYALPLVELEKEKEKQEQEKLDRLAKEKEKAEQERLARIAREREKAKKEQEKLDRLAKEKEKTEKKKLARKKRITDFKKKARRKAQCFKGEKKLLASVLGEIMKEEKMPSPYGKTWTGISKERNHRSGACFFAGVCSPVRITTKFKADGTFVGKGIDKYGRGKVVGGDKGLLLTCYYRGHFYIHSRSFKERKWEKKKVTPTTKSWTLKHKDLGPIRMSKVEK